MERRRQRQMCIRDSIKIALQEVGGPSAGTMFALGIIDRMTAKSLTGGKEISGPGAISYGGQVLAISGIPQKMAGAKEDGAHWFLPVSYTHLRAHETN